MEKRGTEDGREEKSTAEPDTQAEQADL